MPSLSEFMIPVTAFFLFRFLMGFREQKIAEKHRLKSGRLVPVYPIYQGMGMWLGGLVGGLACIFSGRLVYLFLAVTVALLYVGNHMGKTYGLRRDELLKEAWAEITAEEQADEAVALPTDAQTPAAFADDTNENEVIEHGEN